MTTTKRPDLLCMLGMNREAQQVAILGYHTDMQKAKLVAKKRAEGDSYIVVNMSQPVNMISWNIRIWLIENDVDPADVPEIIRGIAQVIGGMMDEVKNEHENKN